MWCIAPEPVVGTVIGLWAIKEDLPIRDIDLSYSRSVPELLSQLPKMDYVVFGPSYEFVLSGAGLGDAFHAAMEERPEFSRIATLRFGRENSSVWIYERRLPGSP
jgi:hypothetical protein